MKAKIYLLFVLAILMAIPAQAELIGTIEHDYDNATVSDTSIFWDTFDLSEYDYQNIDTFELTLDFGQTGDTSYEIWTVLAGNLNGGLVSLLTQTNDTTTQTFNINAFDTDYLDAVASSLSYDASDLSADTFYLTIFDLNILSTNEFKLNSATLKMDGVIKNASVPVPATCWLLISGIIGIVGFRKKIGA